MNRMKSMLSLGVLGLWALGQETRPSPVPKLFEPLGEPAPGKYLIMQGPPLADSGKPRLFRLDTMTGRCWYLQSVPVDPVSKGRVEAWMPTAEFETALQMGFKLPK